eukprot:scaffold539_cov359-Prasinococcus_capsulatus_cf.AAC.5
MSERTHARTNARARARPDGRRCARSTRVGRLAVWQHDLYKANEGAAAEVRTRSEPSRAEPSRAEHGRRRRRLVPLRCRHRRGAPRFGSAAGGVRRARRVTERRAACPAPRRRQVVYQRKQHALAAMEQYNNANLDGRKLSIELVSGMTGPAAAATTRGRGRGGARTVQLTVTVRACAAHAQPARSPAARRPPRLVSWVGRAWLACGVVAAGWLDAAPPSAADCHHPRPRRARARSRARPRPWARPRREQVGGGARCGAFGVHGDQLAACAPRHAGGRDGRARACWARKAHEGTR